MKRSIELTFLVFVIFTILIMGCVPTPTSAPPTFTPSSLPPTFTPPPTATSTPLPSETPTRMRTTIVFFSTDFDSEVSTQFSGVATTESVQGYEGIGTGANVFNGKFLRNSSVPPLPTTLRLTGLPAHTSIDLHFLLAIVDSWDGTCCGSDQFTITVDGASLFTEVFNNLADGGVQSYVPPLGVELVRKMELGFRDIDANDQESGYDMSQDPLFSNIPHTASTLTIEWYASGPGWQGGTDESWAIDNLEVILNIEDN